MKPPLKDAWIFATVMAVFWAILFSGCASLLILGYGRGGGPTRFVTMLILGAVLVALLCAAAYREGWKRGRDDERARSQ